MGAFVFNNSLLVNLFSRSYLQNRNQIIVMGLIYFIIQFENKNVHILYL